MFTSQATQGYSEGLAEISLLIPLNLFKNLMFFYFFASKTSQIFHKKLAEMFSIAKSGT